jgi:hypothetical protein
MRRNPCLDCRWIDLIPIEMVVAKLEALRGGHWSALFGSCGTGSVNCGIYREAMPELPRASGLWVGLTGKRPKSAARSTGQSHRDGLLDESEAEQQRGVNTKRNQAEGRQYR